MSPSGQEGVCNERQQSRFLAILAPPHRAWRGSWPLKCDVLLKRHRTLGEGWVSSAQRFWQSLAILKSRIPWLIAYILGACLFLLLLNKYADRIDAQFSSARDLRKAVQHAIVLVLVFYIFYHTATTISFVNHIKEAVVDLLAANKSMFEKSEYRSERKVRCQFN
jgi:hypothetical protein